VEKADLSKGYQNPKRKLGVAAQFFYLEITELKFGKKMPYILCSLSFFRIMVGEKCVVTHIF